MTQPVRIEPDLSFIQELQAVGGESLKKCCQCATCSVVCPISPGNNPYPRKEMLWAQWGLKDKLLNDIDIWLCHNCGACSDLCIRGAKPSDLMAALRNMTYQRLVPGFASKWMSSLIYLPLLIAIPALIYLIIWIVQFGRLGTAFPLQDGKIVFGVLFPGYYTIDPVFAMASLYMIWTFFNGVKKLITSFKPEGAILYLGGKKPCWIKIFVDVIKDEIITHSKFQDCGADKIDWKIGHMSLLYGFLALFVVTSVVAMAHWGPIFLGFIGIHVPHLDIPMPMYNPIKILANVGAILLLVGLILITVRRLSLDAKKFFSSFYDWYLLGVIWGVVLTGILSELTRLASIKYLAFPFYYMHLVSVFMLITYMPWSKLGHIVYRTLAITYVRYLGRRKI
ncbi:quinone-modifying oxidoreductase, subunit QmoC [Desulfovibrionales bacterium]